MPGLDWFAGADRGSARHRACVLDGHGRCAATAGRERTKVIPTHRHSHETGLQTGEQSVDRRQCPLTKDMSYTPLPGRYPAFRRWFLRPPPNAAYS